MPASSSPIYFISIINSSARRSRGFRPKKMKIYVSNAHNADIYQYIYLPSWHPSLNLYSSSEHYPFRNSFTCFYFFFFFFHCSNWDINVSLYICIYVLEVSSSSTISYHITGEHVGITTRAWTGWGYIVITHR